MEGAKVEQIEDCERSTAVIQAAKTKAARSLLFLLLENLRKYMADAARTIMVTPPRFLGVGRFSVSFR